MGQYEDFKRLLAAIEAYRRDASIPVDAEQIDAACERILTHDPLDEAAIEWKRIAELVKELNGGEWPATG